MRILSLIPAATEYLDAMNLGSEIVDATLEYDPWMTIEELAELVEDAEPDLVFARRETEAGAASFEELRAIADRLPSQPAVISLDPATLGESLGCIRAIAQAVDDRRVLLGEREVDFDSPGETKDVGVDLLRALADRIDAVKLDLRRLDAAERPGVVALESLDPPVIAGGWIPQMIELAGGFDLLGMPGEGARETDWSEVRAAEPDTLLLAPRRGALGDVAAAADDQAAALLATGARRIFACDAVIFARPGPRLVEGIEQLAHALHPTLSPEPDGGRLLELELGPA